jgi:hypothetical protein
MTAVAAAIGHTRTRMRSYICTWICVCVPAQNKKQLTTPLPAAVAEDLYFFLSGWCKHVKHVVKSLVQRGWKMPMIACAHKLNEIFILIIIIIFICFDNHDVLVSLIVNVIRLYDFETRFYYYYLSFSSPPRRLTLYSVQRLVPFNETQLLLFIFHYYYYHLLLLLLRRWYFIRACRFLSLSLSHTHTHTHTHTRLKWK